MSRETFDLARAQLRQSGKSSPTFDAIHQAYRAIMADVADLKRSQKARKRREAAKVKLDRSGVQQPQPLVGMPDPVDFLDVEVVLESIPAYTVVSRAPHMGGEK
jgi:putative transposase